MLANITKQTSNKTCILYDDDKVRMLFMSWTKLVGHVKLCYATVRAGF